MEEGFRLGVDVGGTFTDVVLMGPDGTAYHRKVLSTPHDFSVGIREGVLGVLSENGVQGSQIKEYTHGATVATNAIITRTGAATGLITTRGFRDVLEIRRMRVHKLYDLNWEKPPPLVPRRMRMEVPARVNPWGEETVPLDEEAARRAIRRLVEEGAESVAVCFLHAYSNGTHERRVRELIAEEAPELLVSISSEVLPELKEYERTSTTVINAYVQPVVKRYFLSMERDLKGMGMDIPIMVMQSNGGMMPSELARERPIHIIESGPAAGVTGCYHLARRMGLADVMTLDMGGTTAKASLIEGGEISRSPEYEVGGAVSIGHRLMKGSGYLLRVPSVDLAEVGAGGGSVAWVDQGGALKVGPHSTGASPGPACYGLGGREPTTTDANVHLGLTNPEFLAGGSLRIHAGLADRAIQDRVAAPLGLDVTSAAWGIREVANSSLIRALRAVSTERGRDPRRFALFAFGGMGPVHAVDLATELGIRKVVVPPLPGLFSSVGLLFAGVEHHLVRTHYARFSELDLHRLNGALDGLVREAASTLEREGYDAAHRSLDLSMDLRYVGQDYALTVPLNAVESPFPEAGAQRSSGLLDDGLARELVEGFHREHARTYGYRSDHEEVQVVAVRCVARGTSASPRVPAAIKTATAQVQRPSGRRRAYFGREIGWVPVPVVGRSEVSQSPRPGPMVIEEDNSLTVVNPGWKASLDEWSNIVLEPG
jgi:N-methylhydantoinase A